MIKRKIILGIFLVFVIFLISFSSASTYMRSNNAQYTQQISYFSPEIGFDSSMCEAGQDFLIQISPLGCTPSVVRSDLLEEQNVPVFCQLAATQINPLIDVEAIERVSFSGEVPKEVSGIGFHPAKAALLVGEKLNYPVLENIGYVVINLKRQRNESAMPDFVEGNLSAEIKYDIKKAFGVGSASFYLPEMNEEKWSEKYKQYGFWEAKGFLRAENINTEEATISIYDKLLRRISSSDLKEGETSKDIIIPGFDFCQGTLKIKLHDLEAPDTRAKLKINADVVEVAENEKFLDNKCEVKDIEKQGLVQKVKIYCREDGKPRTFNLIISPKINLSIEGKEKEAGVGDFLYPYQDKGKEKFVYLGYIGSKGSEKLDDLFVYFVSMPEQRNLTEKELSSMSSLANTLVDSKLTGVGVIDFTADIFKRIGGIAIIAEKSAEEKKSFYRLDYKDKRERIGSREVFGKNVEIVGFAGIQDEELNEEILGYYGNATEDYNVIMESYPGEKYPEEYLEHERTLGERALYQQIFLSNKLGQKKTMNDLIDEFKERYPNSDYIPIVEDYQNGYKLSNSEISSRTVTINGEDKEISFEDIYEPTYDDYGAEILIRGSNKIESFKFRKNQIIELSGFRVLKKGEKEQSESVQLISLEEDYATIKVNLVEGIEKYFVSDEKKLEKDVPESLGEYTFILKEINLKKVAKVSVIPNIKNVGTEASFSFKIGIEKRGIKLSHETIKEKIENLNSSITKWEDNSEKLGKIVEVEKTACLATGGALIVKNLFTNLRGKGIARQIVMKGEKGWYERCTDMVSDGTYISPEQCLLNESDKIDRDVENYYEKLNAQNEKIKELQGKFTSEKKILAESVVNTSGFMEKYIIQVQGAWDKLKGKIGDKLVNPDKPEESIDINEIKNILTYNAWKNNIYDLEDLREIELYASILEKNPNDIRSKARLYSLFVNIQKASGGFVERKSFLERYGFEEGFYGSTKELKEISITKTKTFGEVKNKFSGILLNETNYVYPYKDKVDGKEYLIVLDNDYVVNQTYLINSGVLSIAKENDVNPLRIGFKKYDKKTYQNEYKASSTDDKAVIRYYETEPYKGMPAIVPFDLKNGWYAATKQVLPTGRNIRTFDASGAVNSFWLCNVGENGIEEFFSGFGDDKCEGINLGTGQPYNQFSGLEEEEAKRLTTKAVDALTEAARKYGTGVSYVVINGQKIPVGKPALDIPEIQCQDFMSPKECNLIFNVCDPVICPSSRCDFGGAYPVRDVIQTGVVGSTLLCLPNFREGILVPVCLTGIKAGIDNWISIKKSYRDCLKSSLETGQMTGICDEIYSIYLCEFFWHQALPLVKIAVPKMTEFLLGQNVRGGGEYMSVENAFEKARGSVDYFTQYYGAESYKAFKVRTTEEIGSVVCKDFLSLVTPKSVDLFDKMIEPDSPPQFMGRFDEIPFTTVTVPPISHYKVFYHIFAGKDSGAYYSVYLRAGEGSFYQDVSAIRAIASGYIPVGGFVTDTPDFTAPSGYKKLCINVNGQEECGFKEVSTSFAVDYIKEQYLAQQAEKTQIKTEKDCSSGSASLYNLLNPNLQSAAQELVNPEIYDRGIIRICASDNPGKGSDPYAGTEDSRWMEVGYCGNEKIKCWIDTESVKDVIDSPEIMKYIKEGKIETIEEAVLKDVTQNYLNVLMNRDEYISEKDFKAAVREIEKPEISLEKKIELVNKVIENVFYNHQKAYLLLLRGRSFGGLASKAYDKMISEKIESKQPSEKKAEKVELSEEQLRTICKDAVEDKMFENIEDCMKNKEKILSGEEEKGDLKELEKKIEESSEFISPVFEFKDGKPLMANLYYIYFKGKWKWSPYKNTAKSEWIVVPDLEVKGIYRVGGMTKQNEEFIKGLDKKSYSEGLKLLMDRTLGKKEGILNPKLSTYKIDLLSDGTFIVRQDVRQENVTDLYFKFDRGKWQWSPDLQYWMIVPETAVKGGIYEGKKPVQANINLIQALEGEVFYEGAKIIFGINYFGKIEEKVEEKEVTEGKEIVLAGNCQKKIGEEILKIAEEKKKKYNINDAKVKADTGAENFECLVLQVAMQESSLQHCKEVKSEDCLYCEKKISEILIGEKKWWDPILNPIKKLFKISSVGSTGVMQIYVKVHKDELKKEGLNVLKFKDNVKFGIEYLNRYSTGIKYYKCTNKNYAGWKRSLRFYNGWNTDCSIGNVNYVEEVTGEKNKPNGENTKKQVIKLFPECA